MSTKNFLSFGYGSNMPTLRTKERCPSARAIGIAALHGHELRWHKRSRDSSGKCDIIKSEKIGAVVWGVVFEIPLTEKAALDRAEGLGKGYVEQGFNLFVDDTEAKCVAYVATDIDPGLKPYDWYKELVLLGALEHGINEEYIRGLRETEALRDLDEKRASQQWALVDRVRHQLPDRLHTTVGLAGMSWPLIALKDCVRVVGGSTPRSDVAAFWDGDIPWTTPKDLSGLNGKYLNNTPRKITAAGLKSCASEVLPPNSVLFSSRAPIGHVAINTVPMATNQGFKSMVPGPRVDASFLYWWLKCHRAQLEQLGNGATFKEVSKAIVERIEIPLPPLQEQKRIAAILDQADELRRNCQRALDRLNQLGQAIFVEMFGDPVADVSRPSITALRFEAGWSRSMVGAQLTLQRGVDITKGTAVPGEVPVISSGGVSFYHSIPLVKGPGVLLGRKGSVGKVHYSSIDYWPHDTTLYVKDFKGNQPKFVYHFFLHFPISQYEASAANPSLNRNNVHPVEVLWPPVSLQECFARQIYVLEHQAKSYLDQLQQLEMLFQSLQSRAFHGELTASSLNEAAA